MVTVKHELESLPIFPPGLPKPCCPLCGKGGTNLIKLTTRTSNRNGNANRPYLKCSACRKFITFTDTRGDHAINRVCHCYKPSRLQVSSLQKGRKLHYVCSTGQCGFYDPAMNRESKHVVLPEDLVKDFADLNLI